MKLSKEELDEKLNEIAEELVKHGAKAVILSGSYARGKKNPNDLDITIWGNLSDEKILDILEEKFLKIGISLDFSVFSEEYIDSLIAAYRKNKDLLGIYLASRATKLSGRADSWPLVTLLSDEDFHEFFGRYFGYHKYHPYITREYIILRGREYVERKRRELYKRSFVSSILSLISRLCTLLKP